MTAFPNTIKITLVSVSELIDVILGFQTIANVLLKRTLSAIKQPSQHLQVLNKNESGGSKLINNLRVILKSYTLIIPRHMLTRLE